MEVDIGDQFPGGGNFFVSERLVKADDLVEEDDGEMRDDDGK